MPKILFRREKKEFVPELNREVTSVKAKQYFVSDDSKIVHTSEGSIPASELVKPSGSKVFTQNSNKEFVLLKADFIDVYKRLRKLPQTIPLKDIGFIVTETGIDKDSIVVDAGAGSGALSCFLAHLCKHVTTYEIRSDFLANVESNIQSLGLKNICVKNKSIYDGIEETNVDVVTLDLPEPWLALPSVEKALRVGGFVVSYSPSVPQIVDFVSAVQKNEKFLIIKTVELSERLWEVNGRRVRPKSIEIGHSGFLTLVRRIC